MLLSEYDENKIRELFLAEGEKRGEINELVGLVYGGVVSLAIAETRAKEKYGIENATFREMVKNYDLSKERVKVEA